MKLLLGRMTALFELIPRPLLSLLKHALKINDIVSNSEIGTFFKDFNLQKGTNISVNPKLATKQAFCIFSTVYPISPQAAVAFNVQTGEF